MLISANFVPSNFEIFDFYGDETCFAWSNDKIVIFPYVKSDSTSKLLANIAPRNIRSLRCFDGRIFVLCKPAGVYKLLKTYKFSSLSSIGIANGPMYYEVFTPENNWLNSQNKSTKIKRQLFQLEASSNGAYNLLDITINKKNSELRLRRAINLPENNCDENVCIVANNRRVFKITQNEAQLIYRSEQEIIDIVGILRGESIAGIVLVNRDAATLVYVVKEKLIFDKVYLDSNVHGLCAGMSDESDDTIWLAHIDGTRIHYWTKTISDNTFRKTNIEFMTLLAIKNYKSKLLICLSDTSQLHEISIDSLEFGKTERDEFIGLKPEMLKGTETIVDTICERSKELQIWNEKLLEKQEKLKRINIYSHKQRIVCIPKICVERRAGQLFVRIKFQSVLPFNCYMVVGLLLDRRVVQCIKFIEDSETTIDLSLINQKFDDKTMIQGDLVTLAEELRAWCLIIDSTRDPKVKANLQIPTDRSKFFNAKLVALGNLTSEGGVTMRKLSEIKKNIRRELENL